MRNLIIFGPPGAGKGTQAKLIAQKYKLTHLSSGEILRQARGRGSLGKKIKGYQDKGQLVPDALIISLMENRVARSAKRGVIFDGYPRTLRQAKALDKFLNDKKNPLKTVLNLRLSETEAIRRIMHRSKTSRRSDDNPKTIHNRFRVYRAQTAPLLEYYAGQKKVITIDDRPPIAAVFKAIVKKLK